MVLITPSGNGVDHNDPFTSNVIGMIEVQAYLIFVIFLHWQNFWRIKFTPKKRVYYDKIHSELPIFCVITAKYTVNCQFFVLNL